MLAHLLYGVGGTILGYAVKSFFGVDIQTVVATEVGKLKADLLAELSSLKSKL